MSVSKEIMFWIDVLLNFGLLSEMDKRARPKPWGYKWKMVSEMQILWMHSIRGPVFLDILSYVLCKFWKIRMRLSLES